MEPTYADRTVTAYRRHAAAAIANWSRYSRPSEFLRRFARRLPPSGRVLDYGCGIGTDLAWLSAQGFQVDGIDGTPEFVAEARRRVPGATLQLARFESVELPQGDYAAVWCRAALLHVPPDELARQLAKLRRALAPGGWLGLTLSWGRTQAYTRQDWIPGRYVGSYAKAAAAGFLRAWRVEELRVVNFDGRQGRWIQALACRA